MTGRGAAAVYSDVIRERWRRPRFRGPVEDATTRAEDVNPLCGDRVRIELRVDGGRVTRAGFTGDSCAICTASADVLSELVTGKIVSEARAIEARDVLDVLDADVRPTRMRCVTLPVTVCHAALADGRESR